MNKDLTIRVIETLAAMEVILMVFEKELGGVGDFYQDQINALLPELRESVIEENQNV